MNCWKNNAKLWQILSGEFFMAIHAPAGTKEHTSIYSQVLESGFSLLFSHIPQEKLKTRFPFLIQTKFSIFIT